MRRLGKRGLVLGVGNLLWADEGFGPRCVEAFAERFEVPEHLTLADGGTQGLYLVDLLREHDPVVIFDAVDFGDAPGTLRLVENEDIPSFVAGRKVSLHQAGLQDVIACAELLGGVAEHMLLIGVQPLELEDYGGSLRPAVKARMPQALELARSYLRKHGFELRERSVVCEVDSVITPGLGIRDYEGGRPAADDACRIGDARVLTRTQSSFSEPAENS